MDSSTTSTDFKSPEQIAEATRQTVRATGGGEQSYVDHDVHAPRPDRGHVARLLDDMKARSRRMREQGGHYVAERPVSSVMMAAAGGAAVTTLMWAALRKLRH